MNTKRKSLFRTLFLFVAIFVLASADFEDIVVNIKSVSTDPVKTGSSWQKVSLEGGAYLYIKGSGFSTRSADSNRVTLNDTNCPVIEFLTTNTQVVCQVPSSTTAKTASVNVFVDNTRVGTCTNCVTYAASSTPQLISMIPNAANPGDEIYYYGNQRVKTSEEVDFVKIGDYRCDSSDQNEFNAITFTSGNDQAPCNVPSAIEAGYYSVSQRNLQSTGFAKKMPTLPTYRFNGNPYDFVVAPKISSISSNVGSPEGQIITITGSGFSSTDQNEVNLADTPCNILEQTPNEIKCEVQPRSTPISDQGYHAGLKYEVYSGKNIASVRAGTAGSPSYTGTKLTTEIPQNLGTSYTSKFSGYFKAPTTGNYKFVVASDDKAQIYISTTTPLDKTNLQLIVDLTSYTSYRFFYTKGYNQTSNGIALTAGEYYYIELYHEQGSGADSATFGVQIPNAQNTVNPTTEVQSIKLNCPTINEILEFKISGVTGGQWRIRFDYLSTDGKSITSTSRTGNMTHITTVSKLSSQISSAMGIQTQAVIEMQKEDGTVTTNETEARIIIYKVTFLSLRKNGMLPVIENLNLTGTKITTKVTQTQEPSPPIGGTFSITYGGKNVDVSPYASTGTLANALINLGYQEPIRVAMSGNTEQGAEWRVQFVGDGAGPVAPLTTVNSLTGCSDPNQITIDITTIQDSSQDLFYEVIPMELLFTAENKSQITVKSNGVLGNCPGFNCDYELQSTGVPEITAASYSGTTLSLSLGNIAVGNFSESDVSISLGNIACQTDIYDDSNSPATISATCSNVEAGDFNAKVHFNKYGYASVATGVSLITVSLTISNVSPTEVNPNGGTILTVSGSGFPSSLEIAQTRGMTLQIGTATCTLISVSSTSITCVNTPINSGASLNIGLNGKTATSSVLSISNTVPTISSLSQNSANPVLQTDITITGSNFDSNIAQTKVLLSNTVNSQVTECLTVSSNPTHITCKLLGAPTGTYNLYVQTSAGYSMSQTFTVQTEITSISPTSGSVAGGTLLTITGGTFSDDIRQTLAFVGSGSGSGTDTIACTVVTSSANQVTCLTGPLKDLTKEGVTQTVYVDTRIVETAVCTGTCSFTYSNSLTPYVSAIDFPTVAAGGTLQITGTNLDSSPSGTDPTVTIGGVTCAIISASATQIAVSIPSTIIPTESANIVISVAGKGYAQFDSSLNSTVKVTPAISAISPTTGSNAGALLTITGAGFQEGAVVKVGTTSCEIRSLTPTSITCKTTGSGEVSLSYNKFTDIKCATACTFSKAAASTPTVSSISSLAPSSPSFTLTIQGTKLDIGAPSVILISTTDKSITFTGSVSTSSASQVVVSFTDVAAGSYSIEVASDANLAASSSIVVVPLSASISSPIESSLAGGATLTISGSGFFGNAQSDKNKVSICGFPCKVTQSTISSITCETPLFVNSAVLSTYNDIIASSMLTPSKTFSDNGKENVVFDTLFTTSYTTSTTSCHIGIDIGANLLAQLSEINYFPNPATTASNLRGTVIEGSNDGTTYTNVYTIDANAHDGWNTIKFDTPVKYRYYRLSGGSSSAKCALAELKFYGIVLSSSTETNLNGISCGAIVTVNDQSQQVSSAVNYKQTNTAILESIVPDMGTTAGGTTVTLSGSDFETNLNDIEISIEGVPCVPQTALSSQITCVTGAAPAISSRKSSLQSTLTIKFANKGSAITNGLQYFYIDRWSDVNTWGGITPPREGDSVSIPAGQIVLLDISPPKLNAIIIEGALVFEDANIDLNCHYIMINEGRLQIGTENQRIQNKITVTVHGTKDSPKLPVFGNKVIALMGGILDIHGKVRSHTWTSLQTTADAGATSIVVQGSIDWVAGEVIVIASTDHDHYNSESRTIAAALVNTPAPGQTTLTFAEPLKHKHYAGIQTIDGVQFEMRAEVGLLTRNVVVQGDESSQKNQYGVHIMAHSRNGDDSSIARISYTEVRQAGQAFNLGRYPIHFHLIGNVRQSYVLGNAVHHTYNRAVTIHGVHYLKVQKNVAYWVMGHTIFIEDGIETHNVIEDNLVINTMASMSLLETDQTPASFWITNPNNIWRRNHAAGSDRYGFWFDLRAHPEGPSATNSICPVGEKLGEFIDNQAHSNGRYGLRIFHELIPRTNPCGPVTPFEENLPIPAEFKNFLGWKNMRTAIIGERMGAITFKNIKAADNKRAGIEISDGNWSPPFTLRVEDAWIVGITPENGGDVNVYKENGGARGLITPKKEFFIAKNVHFSNFNAGMAAIETCSHCEHAAATTEGAITSFVEGLTFNNVVRRVRFNVPYKEIIVDNDGSLTGNAAKGVVTYFYDHLEVPGCVRNEAVYNGLVCDQTITIRKVELNSLNRFSDFSMQFLDVYNLDNSAINSEPGSIPYRSWRENWAVPFITGYSYRLSWRSRADFNSLLVEPGLVLNENDRAITIVFNHSDFRETYDLIGQQNNINITNSTQLWTTQNSDLKTCGDWYHDVPNQFLYVAVNHRVKQNIKVAAVKCRLNCPVPIVNTPKDGAIRLWSNVTQWPNNQLPQAGEDVVIPADWTLKLDISPPSLGFLHIKGDFYFDETKDNLVLTAQRIWVEGQLFIGNNTDERFVNNAKILLTGDRNSENLVIGPVQDVSNKVLAVTGNITMYGALVNNVFVRLEAPAQVGATTITVSPTVDWKVGDEIFIAPTQRGINEYETRKITAINNGVITLNSSLQFYHFGAATATKETPVGTIDMRAEVGLLTRNIKIEGTDEDFWGARLYVGEIYDPFFDYYFRGRVDLDGIEMKNVGQANTTLAGLTFDRLATGNNDISTVRRSVIRDSQGISFRMIGTIGVTVENNIFYKSYRWQIKFDDVNTNVIFKNNLAVGNRDRGLVPDKGDMSVDFISLFFADSIFQRSEISNNIFAGCEMTCITARGGPCDTQQEGPYTFFDNVAHSGETGWLVTEPNQNCNGISHYTGHHLTEGIMTFFRSQHIKASNLKITDTQIGISLNQGGSFEEATTSITNSYFAALASDPSTYFNKGECSNLASIYISASTVGIKSIPPTKPQLPWYKIKSNHLWKSTFTVSGVTFENYNDNHVTGCIGNVLFQTNPYASDASASTKTSNINLINVGPENLIYFSEPSNEWIGIDDCGGWYCTGIKNLVIRDVDGSLTGKPSSIIPQNKGVFDASTCTLSQRQNAYICAQKGWGLLTFESQDVDFQTRIISPINVTTSNGFKNDLNSYMDHAWDGFYTSLKRLSRFHSIVQDGRDYNVLFTGTLPNAIRWELQGAQSTEFITVRYGYTEPQSVRITDKNGNIVKQTIIQANADNSIKASDPCGTNMFSIDERKVTIKLTGDANCQLKSNVVNSIQASIRYDVSVEEFYAKDGPTQFIDRVAAILRINPASIRIVEIKSGSTIIRYFIDSSYQGTDIQTYLQAREEMIKMIQTMKENQANGALAINNYKILGYSFELVFSNPENLSSSTSKTSKVVIIIAAVVAFIALAVGGYFVYGKYIKKRIIPASTMPTAKSHKFQESYINTENPLVVTTRFDGVSQSISPDLKSGISVNFADSPYKPAIHLNYDETSSPEKPQSALR